MNPVLRRLRILLRIWAPICLVFLSACVIGLAWFIPTESLSHGDRVGITVQASFLTAFLLAGWFLLLGPPRWYVRLGILVLLGGIIVGTIREVSFNGDMEPEVRFRWNPSADELLDAYKREQPTVIGTPGAVSFTPSTEDFPEYRGSKRDGIIIGPAISRDWKENPPREVWRRPAGGGYASAAILGNLAVTIEQRRENEAVVCYDLKSGQEHWVHQYPAKFREPLGGPGPRATPTIAGSEVFSLGAKGNLVCLDLATGKSKWSVNILENNDNIMWGMSGSPLVYGRFVVVNPGVQKDSAKGKALVAYDRNDGNLVWSAGNTKAGYSSPMLSTLAGKQQILMFDAEVLAGYDAKDGHELWHYAWPAYQGINVAQPLVLEGDRVFISTGYHKGCALLHLTESGGKWNVESLWGPEPNKAMGCKFTTPVYYKGAFYGLDDGILACVDEKTGKRLWKDGRYGHGQLLLSENLLVIFSETGKLVLVEANPQAFHELGSVTVFNEKKNWNPLAMAGGKVLLRNEKEMALYDLTPLL
jgi:outer membrane protein assembly factor BamB